MVNICYAAVRNVEFPQVLQMLQRRKVFHSGTGNVELLEVDAFDILNPLDPVLVQGEDAQMGVLFQIFDGLNAVFI